MKSEIKEALREIKKAFFAFRNGMVADKLRKAGDPHTTIMGCLLVDITAITSRVQETIYDNGQLISIAQELWSDNNSRECRLAAPMLYPAGNMSLEQAIQWSQDIETMEIADNLCHKLLRHINDADTLFRHLIADERPLVKYTGYRLLLNMLLLGKVQPSPSLKAIIETENEQAEQPLKSLLNNILEDMG